MVDGRVSLKKPDISQQKITEMCRAILSVKEEINMVSAVLPEMKTLKILQKPLQSLAGKLGYIESTVAKEYKEKERLDKKFIEDIAGPVDELGREIVALKVELKDVSSTPHQGICSIVELADEISELSTSIEKIQNAPIEIAEDITDLHSKI
ncbi:hypothetical protein JTB14_024370 [Gonioctena quinquepunctata]|nr:hypothetical protein JTB14_024370 [Gonioctena quinquepunctata]